MPTVRLTHGRIKSFDPAWTGGGIRDAGPGGSASQTRSPAGNLSRPFRAGRDREPVGDMAAA